MFKCDASKDKESVPFIVGRELITGTYGCVKQMFVQGDATHDFVLCRFNFF